MTEKNAIEIYSTHNKGKSFVAEKFIRTLTLIRLGFLRVVFPGEGGVNLTPPLHYFKVNLSNINITL